MTEAVPTLADDLARLIGAFHGKTPGNTGIFFI